MSSDDGEFQQAGSGASDCFPMQCSALRKGGYVVIKDRPCKVVDMSTSKTGKHGHAKVHLVAVDIFTSKKMEELCPSTHNMMVPNVSRDEYQLIDVNDDGYVSLLLANGDTKNDLKLPTDEVGDLLKKDFDAGKDLLVAVLKAMGEEAIIGHKENPNK